MHGNQHDKLPDSSSETSNINHRGDAYPQLGLSVLLVGNCFRAGAIAMFAKAGCRPAKGVEDADLVCFLGGEDVDPKLYGEQRMQGTYYSEARDKAEIAIFERAQQTATPCFGICRGMQFLHVMNGGKLWQHVTNHAGADHVLLDQQTGEEIVCSSMHHQMCIEDATTFPIAYSTGHAGVYIGFGRELSSSRHADLEAATWPNIDSIGVQGHPEVAGLPEYTAWCLRKVEEFMIERDLASAVNPDRIDPSAVGPKLLH